MGGRAMRIASLSAFPIDVDRTRRGGAFGSTERDAASAILRAVRRGGDAAVLRTVRRFDHARARPDDLIVEGAALRRAARDCPRDVSRALDLAYGRIRAFHERQRPREAVRRDATGELRLVPTALDRVGALVPRGRSSYPSTVLMTGVPSQVAGVRALAVASPMPPDGSIDPALAYALQLVGATVLYRAGGAAAVAALAYGTRSLPRVDKIVGPGNAYTAAAKWLVSADVGIDALQGPSELVAVASSDADVDALALDLLAQAEHGAGAFAALISDDAAWVRAVAEAIGARTARVRGYRARDLGAAVSAANDAAPEHVLLAGRRAIALADRVNRAGALFIGARSAVAFGDYVAGTNHALPTGGTARWSSALRVDDYVRWTSRVSLHGELRNLARAAAAIADHEGMRFHKASIEARV
ncbi:MAG: histidinol dehydrogenase [Chloroflexi bacterium 13_1_40CM_67_9]|nr:MAG: histidinol dehydrogenase [Chloroflexi bacterium 13_1_40CM_67_9]